MVAINGEAPQVFECICCGDRERPALFSIRKGGLVCSACSGRTTDGMALKTSTLYAMQYIISSNIEKLYTFTVKEEILEELGKVVRAYLDVYVDRHFKSLEILETIVE
ncbi:MAG: DNA repair protein RecO [[Clostridium] scindens]